MGNRLAGLGNLYRRLSSLKPKFLRRQRKPEGNIEPPDVEHITNFLSYNLKIGLQGKLPLMDVAMTADTYELLNLKIPYLDELKSLFDSQQGEDGTWNTGKKHYIANTAHILMFYKRAGISPKLSAEPFLSEVDTWSKVVAHAKRFNGDNFWGSIWGHFYLYILYKNTRPPWTQDFLKRLETDFKSWALDNHQRTHVATLCFLLCEPLPRNSEVIKVTLKQQNPDGGWGFFRNDSSNTRETAQTIWLLEAFRNPDVSVDQSVEKATNYVLSNYKTEILNSVKCGGFSFSFDKKMDVKSTTYGVTIMTGNTSPYLNWRMCKEST